MNRVFKCVWNSVTHTWAAVSEIQTSRTKSARGSRVRKSAVALALTAALANAAPAWGAPQDTEDTWEMDGRHTANLWHTDAALNNINQNFFIGSEFFGAGGMHGARHYNSLTLKGSGDMTVTVNNLHHPSSTGSTWWFQKHATMTVTKGDFSTLLAQSGGWGQQILSANTLVNNTTKTSAELANSITVQNANVETDKKGTASTFLQIITEGDSTDSRKEMAEATYLIGSAAASAMKQHYGNNWNTGVWEGYSANTGVMVNTNTDEGADGMWMLSILDSVYIYSNKTLTLDITGTEGNPTKWYAKTTGDNAATLVFKGQGQNTSFVDVENFQNPTTTEHNGGFNGTVVLKDVTANLYSGKALGNPGTGGFSLNATDSTIVVHNKLGTFADIGRDLTAHNLTVDFQNSAEPGIRNSHLYVKNGKATFSGTNTFISHYRDNDAINKFPAIFFEAKNMEVLRGGSVVLDPVTEDKTAVADADIYVYNTMQLHETSALQGVDKLWIGQTLRFEGIHSDAEHAWDTAVVRYGDKAHASSNAGRGILANFDVIIGQEQSGQENHSDFWYGTKALQTQSTTIKTGSTLHTWAVGSGEDHATQLGQTVTLEQAGKLYVHGQNNATTTKLGRDNKKIDFKGNGQVHLVGTGTGSTLEVDTGINFNEFAGSLVFEQGTFQLNRAADGRYQGESRAGMEIDAGTNSVIQLTDNDTVNLKRFGFVGQGGVLDVSGFRAGKWMSGSDNYALKVDTLVMDAGATLRIDKDALNLTHGDPDVPEQGSGSLAILNFDNDHTQSVWVVAAHAVTGSGKVTLESQDDAKVKREFYDDKAQTHVATGTWNTDAFVVKDDNEHRKNGIYVGFVMTELDLLEGKPDSGVSDVSQWKGVTLNADLASDNTLSAKVTGHGQINIVSDQSKISDQSKTVVIANEENDFKGLVDVRSGHLQAGSTNALGTGEVSVTLASGSNLSMAHTTGDRFEQALQTITFKPGTEGTSASRVILQGNTLVLTQKTNVLSGVGLLASEDLDSALQQEAQRSANFVYNGTGGREQALTFENVDTLNGYKGILTVGQTEDQQDSWVIVHQGTSKDEKGYDTTQRVQGYGHLELDTKADFNHADALINFHGTLVVGENGVITNSNASAFAQANPSKDQAATDVDLLMRNGAKWNSKATSYLKSLDAEKGASYTLHYELTDGFSNRPAGTATNGMPVFDDTAMHFSGSANLTGATIDIVDSSQNKDSISAKEVLFFDDGVQYLLVKANEIQGKAQLAEGIQNKELKLGSGNTATLSNWLEHTTSDVHLVSQVVRLDLTSNVDFATDSHDSESQRTLSAHVYGDGGITVTSGKLIIDPTQLKLGCDNGDCTNRFGFLNVNSGADLTIVGEHTLSGQSTWNDYHAMGSASTVHSDEKALVRLSGTDATLTITGTAASNLGDNNKGYQGTLELKDGATVTFKDATISNSNQELFAGKVQASGTDSSLVFDNVTAQFDTSVQSLDALSASHVALKLANNANVKILAEDGQQSAVHAIDLADGSTLTLQGQNSDAWRNFRLDESVTLAGAGTLHLKSVTMRDKKNAQITDLSFGAFTGTVALSDAAHLHLTENKALFHADVAGDSKLSIHGASKLQSMTWAGTVVLADDNAPTLSTLTLTGNVAVSGANATLTLSQEYAQKAHQEATFKDSKPANSYLSLDDGLLQWTAIQAANISGGQVKLDLVRDATDGADQRVIQSVFANGVTGHFGWDLAQTDKTLDLVYKLKKAEFAQGSSITLTGGENASLAENSWTQVAVQSTERGAGSIVIDKKVGLDLAEGSNYSGSLTLNNAAGLVLTQSQANESVKLDLSGIELNQAAHLDTAVNLTGALNALADSSVTLTAKNDDQSRTLTITGENNTLAAGFQWKASLAQDAQATVAVGENAHLTVEGALLAFGGFVNATGTSVVLQKGSSTTLRETTGETPLSLDAFASDASALLVLESGRYSATQADWSDMHAKLNVGGTLTLRDWALADENKQGAFANELTGKGTIEVAGIGSGVTVYTQDKQAFTGTWNVANQAQLQWIGNKFDLGKTVNLGENASFLLQAEGTTGVKLSSSVIGEGGNTLLHVQKGTVNAADAVIEVSRTEVDADATLVVGSLEQLGTNSVTLHTLGTQVGDKQNWQFQFGRVFLQTQADTHVDSLTLVDKGMFVFDLGNRAHQLTLGSNNNFDKYEGGFVLTHGTLAEQSGEMALKSFYLAESGTLTLNGQTTVDNFGWFYSQGALEKLGDITAATNAGILDLTNENIANGQPALIVKNDLIISGGVGVIQIDPTQWIPSEVDTNRPDVTQANRYDNLLSWDEGNIEQQIIRVEGNIDKAGSLVLRDQQGNTISKDHEAIDIWDNARLHWGYNAKIDDKTEGAHGVYVSYGLTELELTNIDESKSVVVLKAANEKNEGKTFDARITGQGRLQISAGANDVKEVILTRNNTFSGTVSVDEGVKLVSKNSHTLGGGVESNGLVSLTLNKNAQWSLEGGGVNAGGDERLGSLTAADGAKVTLSNNTLTLVNASTFEEGSSLAGSGTVMVQSSLEFADAYTALNGFLTSTSGGQLGLGQQAKVTLTGSSETPFVLNAIYTAKEQRDTQAALMLDLNAQVGDMGDFMGTYHVTSGHKLTHASASEFNQASSVVLGGKTTWDVSAVRTSQGQFALHNLTSAAGDTIVLGAVQLKSGAHTGIAASGNVAFNGTTTLDVHVDENQKLSALDVLKFDDGVEQTLVSAQGTLSGAGQAQLNQTTHTMALPGESNKATVVLGLASHDKTIALTSQVTHLDLGSLLDFDVRNESGKDATLSATIAGSGGLRVTAGTLTLDSTDNTFGSLNVGFGESAKTDHFATLVLAGNQTLRGESVWSTDGATTRNAVQTVGDVTLTLKGSAASLTIVGTAASHVKHGDTETKGFAGTLALENGASLTFKDAQMVKFSQNTLSKPEGNNLTGDVFEETNTIRVSGTGSTITMDNVLAYFDAKVEGNNDSKATLALSNDSKLAITANAGQQSAVGTIDLAAGTQLLLHGAGSEATKWGNFASQASLTGEGTLGLYQVKANNTDTFNLSSFTGSVSLLKKASLELANNQQRFGVKASNGSTLSIKGADSQLKSLDMKASNLQLHVVNGAISTLDISENFTVTGTDTDASSLVLDKEYLNQAYQSATQDKNVLSLDDGVGTHIITAQNISGSDLLHLKVLDPEVGPEGSSAPQGWSTDLAEGVTGDLTYGLNKTAADNKQAIELGYKLNTVTFKQSGATLALVGGTNANQKDSSWDNVAVNSENDGYGTLELSGAVGLSLAQSSNFSGKMNLKDNAFVKLGMALGQGNLATYGATLAAIDLGAGAKMHAALDVKTALNAAANSSYTMAEGHTLTLVGENVLQSGFAFARDDQATDKTQLMVTGSGTTLVVHDAATAFNDYMQKVTSGTAAVAVQDRAKADLSTSNRFELDAWAVDKESSLILTAGEFVSHQAHANDLLGTLDVAEKATLILADWDLTRNEDGSLRDSGTALSNTITGSGTIRVANGHSGEGVTVNSNNAKDFMGTWSVGSVLEIDRTQVGGTIALDDWAELRVRGIDNGFTKLSNVVTGNQTLLHIASGNVEIDVAEGQIFDVGHTTVAEDAVVVVHKLAHLGHSADVEQDGHIVLQSTKNETLDGMVLAGQGYVEFDLGGRNNLLSFGSNDIRNFTGAFVLTNGTVRYAPGTESYTIDTNFFLAHNSSFEVHKAVTVKGNFGWKYDASIQGHSLLTQKEQTSAAILDLTQYQYDGSGPAVTVEGDLIISGGVGQVRVDASTWLPEADQRAGMLTGPNVPLLSRDNGDLGAQIIHVKGNMDIHGSLELRDENGQEIGLDESEIVTTDIAKYHYSYGLKPVDQGDSKGVYMSWGMTTLELTNADEQLESVVLAPANNHSDISKDDQTLSAKIIGSGRIDVQANGNNKTVVLLNGANNFTGTVTVQEGVTLQSQASYTLSGNPDATKGERDHLVDLVLNEGSHWRLAGGSERVQTIRTADGATVQIANGNTLTLAGSGDKQTTFVTGSRVEAFDKQTGDQGTKSSHSTLKVEGQATFVEAQDTLGDFLVGNGYLTLADGAKATLAGSQEVTLKHITTEAASIGPSTGTLLELAANGLIGDMSGFAGTLDVQAGKTLRFGADSNLFKNASVTLRDAARWDLREREPAGQISIHNLTAQNQSQVLMGPLTLGSDWATAHGIAASGAVNFETGSQIVFETPKQVLSSGDVLIWDEVKNQLLVKADSVTVGDTNSLIDKTAEHWQFAIGKEGEGNVALVTAGVEVEDKHIALNTQIDELQLATNVDFDVSKASTGNASTLSAKVSGAGGMTVTAGTLTLASTDNIFGHLNVNAGAQVKLFGVQTLTGQSAWAAASNANRAAVQAANSSAGTTVRLKGADASLTIQGAAAAHWINDTTAGFDGHLELIDGAKVTFQSAELAGGAQLLGGKANIVVGGGTQEQPARSQVVFDKASGDFAAHILSQNAARASLVLTNASSVRVLALSPSTSPVYAVDTLDLSEGSTLTLAAKTASDWKQFANEVQVKGAGTLALQNVKIGSTATNRFDLAGLTGTLDLQQSSHAALGVVNGGFATKIGADATLTLAGGASSMRALDWSGTLEMLATDNGQLSMPTLTLSDNLKLDNPQGIALKINETYLNGVVKQSDMNVLSRDEGIVHTLISAATSNIDAANFGNQLTVYIQTDNGTEEYKTPINFLRTIEEALADNVTGTYNYGVVGSQGSTIDLQYRLSSITFKSEGKSASLTLAGEAAGSSSNWTQLVAQAQAQNNSLTDIKLVSQQQGAGNLHVQGTVGLSLTQGTNYSGSIALDRDAFLDIRANSEEWVFVKDGGLKLSGVALAQGAHLNAGLDLTTHFVQEGTGAAVTLDARDGDRTVTLVGENTLAEGFAWHKQGDKGATVVVDKDASIASSDAFTAFGDFVQQAGNVSLSAGSSAALGTKSDQELSLDRFASEDSTQVTLTGGAFSATQADWSDMHASLTLNDQATLTLKGWKADKPAEDNQTVQTFANTLLGTGTLAIEENGAVRVTSPNAKGFAGTWSVQNSATLVLDQVQVGGAIELGQNAQLSVYGATWQPVNRQPLNLANTITGTTGSTLNVLSGDVAIDKNATVQVDAINLAAGAQLSLFDGQLSQSVAMGENSHLVLRGDETQGYTHENVSLKLENTTLTGEGYFEFDLAGGQLRFGKDNHLKGFTGSYVIRNGLVDFENQGDGVVPENGNLLLSELAVMKMTQKGTINGSFGWRYHARENADDWNAANAGVLDLSNYDGAKNEAALKVTGNLTVAGGNGVVKLDVDKWIGTVDKNNVQTSTDYLALDDNRGQLIIDVEKQVHATEATLLLADKDGNLVGTEKTQISESGNAELGFGYDLTLHDGGVDLAYNLKKLTVIKDVSENQAVVLRPSGNTADAIKSPGSIFSAQLSGEGLVHIASHGEAHTVVLTHSDNDFAGKMVVENHTTLVAGNAGALGQGGVNLTLNEGAHAQLAGSTNLASLAAGDSSTVTVTGLLTLQQGGSFAASSQLAASSAAGATLEALGDVTFDDAKETVEAFLAHNQGGLSIGSADAEARPVTVTFNGTQAMDVNHVASVKGGTLVLGVDAKLVDLANFKGTLDVADARRLTWNNDTQVNDNASLVLGANTTLAMADRTTAGHVKLDGLTVGSGARLELGTMTIGQDWIANGIEAAGKVSFGDKTTIALTVDPNEVQAGENGRNVFALGQGQTMKLVKGSALEGAHNVTLELKDRGGNDVRQGASYVADLMQSEQKIGQVNYTLNNTSDSKTLAYTAKINSLNLWDTWTVYTNGTTHTETTLAVGINQTDVAGNAAGYGTLVVRGSYAAGGSVGLDASSKLSNLYVQTTLALKGNHTYTLTDSDQASLVWGDLKADKDTTLRLQNHTLLIGQSSDHPMEGGKPNKVSSLEDFLGTIALDNSTLHIRRTGNKLMDTTNTAMPNPIDTIGGMQQLQVSGTSQLHLENVTGQWGTQIVAGEAAQMTLTIDRQSSVLMVDKDFAGNRGNGATIDLAESLQAIDRIVIGDDISTGASTLYVRVPEALQLSQTQVELKQNGQLHEDIYVDTETSVVNSQLFESLQGTGEYVVHVIDEITETKQEDGSYVQNGHERHELVLNAGDANDFAGKLTVVNAKLSVGDKQAAQGDNNAVLSGVDMQMDAGSSLQVVGQASVHDLTLKNNAILDLSNTQWVHTQPDSVAAGLNANRLTLTEGSTLTLDATSSIRIDRDSINTGLQASDSTESVWVGQDHGSLGQLLADFGDGENDQKLFQVIAGDFKVNGGHEAKVHDQDGKDIAGSTSLMTLYSGSNLASDKIGELMGGLKLTHVEGDDKNNGLWVSMGATTLRAYQSLDLSVENADKPTVIQLAIQAAAQEAGSELPEVSLTVNKGFVALASANNSITGNVEVSQDATLALFAKNALGGTENFAVAQKLVLKDQATVVMRDALQDKDGFDKTFDATDKVSVGALDVGAKATLANLSKGALWVSGQSDSTIAGTLQLANQGVLGFDKGQVTFADTADLTLKGVQEAGGKIDLSGKGEQSVTAVFVADSDKRVSDKIAFAGGTLVKTGDKTLTMGLNSFQTESNFSAVDVQKGTLAIDGWNNKSNVTTSIWHVQSLTMAQDTALTLTGDIELHGTTQQPIGKLTNAGTLTLGSSAASNQVSTIIGDFEGQKGSTLVFDVSFGTGKGGVMGDAADGLVIKGQASGQTLLKVNDRGLSKGTDESIVLIEVQGATTLNATLAGAQTIEAGGYSYQLFEKKVAAQKADAVSTMTLAGEAQEKQEASDEDAPKWTQWVLSSYANGEDPDSGTGGKPNRVISPNAGAMIGVAASIDMFDLTLHDRMGARPWINPVTGQEQITTLWMRQTADNTRSHDASGQLTLKTHSNTTILGGDVWRTSAQGNLRSAGLMAGVGNERVKSASDLTTTEARGDTRGWMLGAYATWSQNDPKVDRTGAWVDAWAQYNHFDATLSNTVGGKAKTKAHGWSASVEAGYNAEVLRFASTDGVPGVLYMQPHAQLIYHGAGFDATDMNGAVSFEGKDNVTLRAGVRASVTRNGSNGFAPFAEVNWVHNTKDYAAQYGALNDEQAGGRNLVEVKLGAEMGNTKGLAGYGYYTLQKGAEGFVNQSATFGVRYRF